MGHSKSSSKRDVYSNRGLPHETTKISNKQPKWPSKGIRKRRTNKAQRQQKEWNNKGNKEINKIETNKTIEKINETKRWFFWKINKFDKPLARLIKKKRQGTNKIRNERGEITNDITEKQ